MKYYVIDFCGVKEVDKRRFLKLNNQNLNRDYITWYDDGKNIFLGVCYLSEKDVIAHIVDTIGTYKSKYDMSR